MKYFLDFLSLLVLSEKNCCEIRSVKLGNGYNDSNNNDCENIRKEQMIYIYDLESIEVSILSQVILHTYTNTSHHKLSV